MESPHVELTAVYLRSDNQYVGFIEELPGVTATGATLDEARTMLREIAVVVFDRRRNEAAALLEGRKVVREQIDLPIPRRNRGR